MVAWALLVNCVFYVQNICIRVGMTSHVMRVSDVFTKTVLLVLLNQLVRILPLRVFVTIMLSYLEHASMLILKIIIGSIIRKSVTCF